MNKNKIITQRYAMTIAILVFMLLLCIGYIIYSQHMKDKGRSAPLNSIVKEQLDQARALQKQGKLKQSAEIFEHFALQGYPDAMFYLAKVYEKGWGVKPDLTKSRAFLLNAVEYDFNYRGESAFQLGRLFQKSAGPNCNTIAVKWFKKALEWNYVKASLSLGTHYEKGLGVKQDFDKAIYYYKMANQEGISIAALKHARLIMTGKYGIPKDLDYGQKLVQVALIQLEKDAVNGKASSAKTLGRLYRDAALIHPSSKEEQIEKTTYWLNLASELGDTGAMHDLGHFLIFVDENKNYQEAISLFEKSANKGHGGAATALGRMHIEKKYSFVPQNALPWFKKAVLSGHTGAMKELAIIYYDGKLAPQNTDKAILLLQSAVNKGHSSSKRLLNKYLKKQKQLSKQSKKDITLANRKKEANT